MLQLARSERRSVLFLSVDSANRAQVKSNFSMVVSGNFFILKFFSLNTLPFCPFSPFIPGFPIIPCLPCLPGGPIMPCAPFLPLSPGLPRLPLEPLLPFSPGGPDTQTFFEGWHQDSGFSWLILILISRRTSSIDSELLLAEFMLRRILVLATIFLESKWSCNRNTKKVGGITVSDSIALYSLKILDFLAKTI